MHGAVWGARRPAPPRSDGAAVSPSHPPRCSHTASNTVQQGKGGHALSRLRGREQPRGWGEGRAGAACGTPALSRPAPRNNDGNEAGPPPPGQTRCMRDLKHGQQDCLAARMGHSGHRAQRAFFPARTIFVRLPQLGSPLLHECRCPARPCGSRRAAPLRHACVRTRIHDGLFRRGRPLPRTPRCAAPTLALLSLTLADSQQFALGAGAGWGSRHAELLRARGQPPRAVAGPMGEMRGRPSPDWCAVGGRGRPWPGCHPLLRA